MASVNRPEMAAVASGGGGGDRLSSLPDDALTNILSHLLTDEAVRTSVLSRRWRRAFARVPVVHLVDRRKEAGYYPVTTPVCFEQQVSCAMLSREAGAPIRAFRVSALHPSPSLLDQWVLLALSSGAEDIDVDLEERRYCWSYRRLCTASDPEEGSSSADFNNDGVMFHSLPRRLFNGGWSLRRLGLTNCKLDLPPGHMSIGSLEILFLKRVAAPEGDVQRVISSCPRLTDLTLGQCPSAVEISVPSVLLRTFAMVCCHNAARVKLNSRCLRSLRYRGSLVDKCFFLIESESYNEIKFISIDICEDLLAVGKTAAKTATFTELIGRCTSLTFLHLSLRPSMAYHGRMLVKTQRWSHGLRLLQLKGYLADDQSIRDVVHVLQSLNNLKELSLFPLDPNRARKQDYYFSESHSDNDKIDYSCSKVFVPKRMWNAQITCLQLRLTRISVLNYSGRPTERTLVKLLLSKAKVLQELAVTFAPGCAPYHDGLRREMSSWLPNQRIKVTFAEGKKNKL